MDIKTIAVILTLGRILAISIMAMAISKQRKLSKLPIRKGLEGFRTGLNRLGLALFAMNLVPLLIDVATVLSDNSLHRDSPPIFGIIYALSNMTFSVISAVFVWIIYRQAASTVIIYDDDGSSHHL